MLDCPKAEQIGILTAKVQSLEKEIEILKLKVQGNVERRAYGDGQSAGIDKAIKIVGGVVICGVLLAAGKFTGALEFLLKLLPLRV